ncbi:metallophosphoesterase family protein [Morganella morganii]|uniref:metallophosphoesterase family protein n=1 Tax=Morganella morganii TaxID=582 RepID=UPI001BD9EE5D|nr:metallophosphoesterase [Morganella morganii]EKU4003845.1 metallophosphoesterase [Morganella morganii]MBT0405070.1 metallophosphoesterase [Morganella morganii subsp. morganii]MBT0425130.1 metallophosphoesterase [Morganella morganii subsp. morganii]MBT0472584.1 metallophosphoesterase [Morganella morganii subsp. morganii]QWM01863.1 metallophosphoesterase [Morganella morganii subsp. morganii]
MNCKTIILRFRDLVTPAGETITLHQEIIKSKGSVWWGWWAKPDERVSSEFIKIKRNLAGKPLGIFLFDSGQMKLYEAKLKDIFLNGDLAPCPDPEMSPAYYVEQCYNLWFELFDINQINDDVINDYAYSDKVKDFFDDHTLFSVFDNKQVSGLRELRFQDRTIWFVNDYDPKKHESHEILLNDANIGIPGVFPKRPVDLHNGKVVWFSDIHFDEDKEKHQFNQVNQLPLSKILIGRQDLDIDGMIISGDLTWKATKKEFELTTNFFNDICSVKRVKYDAIGFCPGNHDVSFSKTLSADVKRALNNYHEAQMGKKKITKADWNILAAKSLSSKSKENYENFFKLTVGTEPNEFLSMGKRFIIRNQKIVDFCFLNSNFLQQHQLAFQGQGFVGAEQLDDAEKKMLWQNNEKIKGGYRVVVLHHNLYPVNYTSEPYVSAPASLVYDTEAIIQWCFKHGVDLILHGHTHERFMTKVSRRIDGCAKSLWITGLGSSGVISSHLVGFNEFAEIDFNDEKINIKFYNIKNNAIDDQFEIINLD